MYKQNEEKRDFLALSFDGNISIIKNSSNKEIIDFGDIKAFWRMPEESERYYLWIIMITMAAYGAKKDKLVDFASFYKIDIYDLENFLRESLKYENNQTQRVGLFTLVRYWGYNLEKYLEEFEKTNGVVDLPKVKLELQTNKESK